jgi:galactonate dehydratase
MATLQDKSDEELVASLEQAWARGHRAFQVPLPKTRARNQGQDFVAAVRRRLETLRQAVGDDADFALDGNGMLTPGDASSLAEVFEHFHLLWFDEPCVATNLAAARKISSRTVTPLGFGRDSVRTNEFQELLSQQMVDVVRPSISKNGITQIRRIAAIAETYYTAVAPYHDGGPIATAATLHLAASLPNFFIQQLPTTADSATGAVRAELAGPAIETVQEGFLSLPQGAGLGIAVNESVLERSRKVAR